MGQAKEKYQAKPFTQWKEGPIKTLVQKELRSLLNDVESKLIALPKKEREYVLNAFSLEMSKRGIFQKVTYGVFDAR